MLTFLPGSAIFALAGLVAASGPVIIHLLNRRRFKVINWAAMDFLLEALQRNRRILQLRDLLLLALRTACVLLFGLALARPYFTERQGAEGSNEPLHAILVLDNSGSMAYEQLSGRLIDEAKSKAKEFLDDLPDGSRVSVLPLCGSAAGFSWDAYRTKDDAREALEKIEPVDRTGTAAMAADLAREAMRQVPELAKRVVFIGDQQLINWPAESLATQLKDLPEMQVVSVAAPNAENTWVESFELQDGIADVETPAVFVAVIRHEGPTPRSHVQVSLSIDGQEIETQTIDLEPGQSREVTFEHRFDVTAEPGKPVFVPAVVSLPPDALRMDDSRSLSVPVVAALPVVFVDQFGQDEQPKRNQYGETRLLRRLLAPVTQRGDTNRQLVQIRHLRIDELSQGTLEDARLVVIAGIANPENQVPLLRDFVRQGGQLVIAAGGQFDPAAWSQVAWNEGAGILPAPLKAQPLGKLPEETSGQLRPFFLAYSSMAHDYFHLASVSTEELQDLYTLPLFFKAVEADVSDAVTRPLVEAEAKRIAQQREESASADAQLKDWAARESRGSLTDAERQERLTAQQQRTATEPAWLLWADPQAAPDAELSPAELAQRTRPRVLAAFDNGAAYLIERKIGRGEVLFVSSGTFSPWNTLHTTNAMLIFDRILRSMLERTLPQRNLATSQQITLPVAQRGAAYDLTRPDGSSERLSVDALGADVYGISIRNATDRGVYKVTALKESQTTEGESTTGQPATTKLWETTLAVNGPSRESEPAVLDEAGLSDRMGRASYRWVGRSDPITLEGSLIRGQNLWKWLIALVLLGLLAELTILARPIVAREAPA